MFLKQINKIILKQKKMVYQRILLYQNNVNLNKFEKTSIYTLCNKTSQ